MSEAKAQVSEAKAQGGEAKAVVVRMEEGIAWVSLNRPEKRNAINPAIVFEMNEVLDRLEMDDASVWWSSPVRARLFPPGRT